MSLLENTQGKRLLTISCKNTKLYLNVTEESEIVKNPVPILWNLEGLYGWVPVEIVKNEVQNFLDWSKKPVGLYVFSFKWQQTYRLRQDVGRMLEELAK
ncbi:MAG: hypothetical protein JSW07_00310 [bacterium]|nr:MAG: hypothetical protein JSW07_00310 [bacterium]